MHSGPETTSELQKIQHWLCWEGCRHIQTFWHGKCVCHRTASFKKRWREREEHEFASKKEMFIALLSAVMQSHIPASCLEVWRNPGTKHTVTDMSRCLQCGVRADTCGRVFLCVCAWLRLVFIVSVYCFCQCVCVRSVYCTPRSKSDMSGHWCQETETICVWQTNHARRKIQTICHNCFITQCLP